MRQRVEFWSSVELGSFLRGLVRELRAAGIDATHRFEVSDSAYRGAAGLAARAHLRWRTYVSYPRHLYESLRTERAGGVAVVCTNTFYAPAVAIRAARNQGLRVVNWVFDLFPDVLVEGGRLRAGGACDVGLGRLARSTFGQADANIFLGERLHRHATQRYGEIPRAAVIPIGADGEDFRAAAPQARPAGRPVRILYCGNLGRMHDIRTLATWLGASAPSGWTMSFRGHGAGFRHLASALPEPHPGVIFGKSLPHSEWKEEMQAADVALVTMKLGAEGLVMPSKTYSAMVAGQAILAVCPRESDLADTVLRHDAGWVVEPGDVQALRAVVASLVAQPDELLQKRRRSFAAGHQQYDQAVLARDHWAALLAQLDPSGPRPAVAPLRPPLPSTRGRR